MHITQTSGEELLPWDEVTTLYPLVPEVKLKPSELPRSEITPLRLAEIDYTLEFIDPNINIMIRG